MTRASARRFLLTLTALGYVEQSGRTFRLTAKVLSIGARYLAQMPFAQRAEPAMRALADRVNEACSAAVLDGPEIVYVARVPGPRIVSVTLTIGARLPAYCTALGRVLLSGLGPDRLAQVLAQSAIAPLTEHTLTDREAIAAAVERAGAEGYALVDQELEHGLRSIAVPLRDGRGAVAAALNVSAQAGRVPLERMREEFLPSLLEAAAEIGKHVGPGLARP
jgi:IclR family pca regulon transcriptional regulator